jgi:hypothetical protein
VVVRVRKEVRGEERRWRRVERKRWSVREDMVAVFGGVWELRGGVSWVWVRGSGWGSYCIEMVGIELSYMEWFVYVSS